MEHTAGNCILKSLKFVQLACGEIINIMIYYSYLLLKYYNKHNVYSGDEYEYALKLIEGSGISMSACREIAVSVLINVCHVQNIHESIFAFLYNI